MVLVLHILIALTSIFYTGFVFLFPSHKKLNIAYVLVALTLISGTYLVLINMSHMISACFTGLIYLGFVTLGLVSTHRKLAKLENKE